MMAGHRVFVSDDVRSLLLQTGEYAQYRGEWLAVLPNDQLVRLTDHAVEEHPGGRVTVSGAIERCGTFTLVRGVWLEAA